MSTTPYVLVYASAARTPFTPNQLLALLAQARTNNAARDVTGLLLHQDGNFLQALEGSESTVRDLYAHIARDPRHTNLIVLTEGPIATRFFSDWAMGFEEAHRLDPAKHPGLSTYLQAPESSAPIQAEHEDVVTFLRTFRDQLL